jgi:hypothetical protein
MLKFSSWIGRNLPCFIQRTHFQSLKFRGRYRQPWLLVQQESVSQFLPFKIKESSLFENP